MPRKLPYIARLAIYFLYTASLLAQTPAVSNKDLVTIQSIDPTIMIELKYATADNLTGQILYPKTFAAQLRRGVALELKNAQDALRPLGYGLKVWDAYRPLAAQKALYAVISDPRFVATPGVRSMHNRGVAVDVTLVDAAGKEVEMPTTFDAMTPAAYYNAPRKNAAVARNLGILQRIMKQNGFYGCRTEWWHFFSRDWEEYRNVAEPESFPAQINATKTPPNAETIQ